MGKHEQYIVVTQVITPDQGIGSMMINYLVYTAVVIPYLMLPLMTMENISVEEMEVMFFSLFWRCMCMVSVISMVSAFVCVHVQ